MRFPWRANRLRSRVRRRRSGFTLSSSGISYSSAIRYAIQSFISIFVHFRALGDTKALELVKLLLTQEIASAGSSFFLSFLTFSNNFQYPPPINPPSSLDIETTLLRGNSSAIKFLTELGRSYGRAYLEAIVLPFVTALMMDGYDYDVRDNASNRTKPPLILPLHSCSLN